MTHASIPRELREAHGVNNGLLRLSAGLENIKDLQEDVLHALDAID
jgi:cystathionine beta-lyase/cystathionine gamma-synthase